MATTTHDESFEESSDPIKYKKLVLRVSIDCEGCRKRVNKILSKVPGVQEVDINLKQQMVTVIGDVDGVFLLKKLRKSGRQVELLPEMNPETVTSKQPVKTKDKGKQPMQDNKEETCRTTSSSNNDGKHAGKIQQPQVKPQVSQDPAANVKTTGGGDESAESSASPGEKTDGVSPSEEVIQESSKESNKSEPESESKSEGKKPVGGELPLAEEKKNVDGENSTPEKVDSGNISKKKKKGGQNGNKLSSSVSDAATDNSVVLPNYSLPANHVLPRDLRYYGYPPDLYTSPPVYAASYNTSHASSSPTTSYYAQQPADSYVYAYSGPRIEPTPSDLDAYNRQPLDSLEMFSDENPNGCSIM